ncbi:carbohydrate sulfotransferase 1-like [Dreissena polymorpha]|uniref:Sulfotransferase domain-containing protein n=1 Tax=Dreissena polymorpha TaxID=45954 RepID=A0A9D4S6S3_DREPO|nr:carbohydrate sulfotransferase 1-like [Dreissena polymorpha]KAH3893701.1 hypothetical protein DPMN_017851 [Dreissena polymorpha]
MGILAKICRNRRHVYACLAVIAVLIILFNKMDFARQHQTSLAIEFGLDPFVFFQPDPTKPTKVIVLAYMHTGSSYTATVLEQHPGSFWESERLHYLHESSMGKNARHGRTIQFLNGTRRDLFTDDYVELAAYTVHNLVNCHHWNLDIGTLDFYSNPITMKHFEKSHDYFLCIANGKVSEEFVQDRILPVERINSAQIEKCYPRLVEQCRKSSLGVYKFIHLEMRSVELLLKRYESSNLKIIHLVRDPRAMLDSHVRKNEMGIADNLTNFEDRAKLICGQMMEDSIIGDELKQQYPGKILSLRYEDMLDQPITKVKEMYDFIRIPLSESVKKFVKESTHSTEFPSWRRHIALEHLLLTERHCQTLLARLGYVRLKDIETVRNTRVADHTSYTTYKECE